MVEIKRQIKMFNSFAKQHRRPLILLGAAAGAGLALIIGLSLCHYRLLLRASEDAYATMLWRQSAKTAGRIEEYIQSMLANMAGVSMSDPSSGLLETEFAADVAAMQRLDDTGGVTGSWSPHPETPAAWPAKLAPEQWAQLQQGLPVVACHAAPLDRNFISIHAPIFQDAAMAGAVSVLINAETVIWRCFPPLDEPLIAGLALYDGNGQAFAETARPEAAGHLRHGSVLRAGPLFTDPERGMAAYRLVRHAGARYLAATAPAMLPGNVTWLAASSISCDTVKKAPRALFRSLVMRSLAWLLLGALLLGGIIYGLRRMVKVEFVRRPPEPDVKPAGPDAQGS